MRIARMDQKRVNLKTKLKIKNRDYQFRFCNFFDQSAINFEEQNIRKNIHQRIKFLDDTQSEREISWPNLTFWQSYRHFIHQSDDYYLLQMTSLNSNRHYQIVIRSETTKISLFSKGHIDKWIFDTSKESLIDQEILLEQLIIFLKNHTSLMSLIIRPYLPGTHAIAQCSDWLAKIGLSETLPSSYLQTRFIDLRPSVSEMLNAFSVNGRARLKIKDKELHRAEVKEIAELETIPHLQEALDASFKRSVKKAFSYNFTPLIKSARQFKNDVVLLGFFFKNEPASPKAFITGISHGIIVEFSVGGSISDPLLRSFPFNHILIWDLALKSKINGSEFFDMGGITSGDELDPLRGISNFKRFFPGFELTTGKEMQLILRPNRQAIYLWLQKSVQWIKDIQRRTE